MPVSQVIIASVLAIVLVVLMIIEHRMKNRKGFVRTPEPGGRTQQPRWTDRFIYLPISVYNRKEEEVTGAAESYDSYLKTLPTQIVEYRPTFLESRPDQEVTEITRRNGDTAVITLSVQEFEATVNKFCSSFDA